MSGSRSRFGVVLGLYAVLVIVHAALGAPMRQPHIFPDELIFLGHARNLSGTGLLPDMAGMNYSPFGYSLFLVPAFLLFPDPVLAYRAVIATNAVLISTVFLAIHCLLHTGFDVSRRLALGVAFATGLYPAFLLQSNFAWSENALIPGYALLVGLFAGHIRRPSVGRALMLGVLTGFLYTIHARALPLLPVTAITLVVLSLRRLAPWTTTAAAIAAIGAVFAATQLANDALREGWSAGSGPSAASYLGRLTSAAGFAGSALGGSGQALYLAQSTCGLSLVPAMWLAVALRREGPRVVLARYPRPSILTVAFALVSSLVLFGTSALAVAGGGWRADHLVYGRYNEMFLAPWLAFGLVLLASDPRIARSLPVRGLVFAAIVALTAGVLGVWGGEIASRDFVAPNIFGIHALVRAVGHVNLLQISSVSAALFLALAWLFGRTARAGLTAIAMIFLAGALYSYPYAVSAQAWIGHRDDVPSRIRGIGGVTEVSYDLGQTIRQTMDLSTEAAARYFSSQYLLPHTRLRRFSSERGELPPAPMVISTRTWPDAERLRARFVTSERDAETALWVLPASKHYFSASQQYVGVALGWRWFPGIWESGFHARERDRDGSFRWTTGQGRLIVPVNEFPTRLTVDLRPVVPDSRVRILVNGAPLFDGTYHGGPRTFDLTTVPVKDWVTIDLLSDAIVPRDRVEGSVDTRRLGVAVREIRLLEY